MHGHMNVRLLLVFAICLLKELYFEIPKYVLLVPVFLFGRRATS